MRLHFLILTFVSLTAMGQQQLQCAESWNKFDQLHFPVDFRFKVYNNPSTNKSSELKIEVIPNERTNYDFLIEGIRLHLTNWSDSTIRMQLSFFDVTLICQALSQDGIWTDIERPISMGFCGTEIEYYDLTLKTGDYIKLKAPCYSGSTRASMRYKLSIGDITVYSDEFEGYLNPGQME